MIKVLYATRKGEPDYMEEVLTDKPELFNRAKHWAIKNGYDRFRIATIDLSTKPDFIGTINK